MEVKQILYTGTDTENVTRIMEEAEKKMAAKGWRSRYAQLLHHPGQLLPRPRRGRRGRRLKGGHTMALGLIVGIVFIAAVLIVQKKQKDDDE